MIIYVNIDKQTGQVSINQDYPKVDGCLEFSPNTIVDTNDSLSFEISFIEGIYIDSQGYVPRVDTPTPPIIEGP